MRFGALRCLSSLTHLFLAVLFWDGWLLIHSSWWYSVGFWRFPVFEPSSPGRYIFHHVLNSPSHRPGLFHHQNTKNVFGLFFLGGRKTLWGVLNRAEGSGMFTRDPRALITVCFVWGPCGHPPSIPHIPAHFNVCPSSKFSPFRIFELLCKIRKRLFNRIKKARLGSMPTGLICPRNVNKLVRYL